MSRKLAFLPGRIVLTWMLCLSLAGTRPAPAGGEVTDCTADGLDAALTGGLVTFNCNHTHAPGTIAILGTFTITTNNTIDGSNGGNTITLDGLGNTRIISLTAGASLTLTHLILSRGSADGDGGCLYTNGALKLNNVELEHCQAGLGGRGGALFVDSAGSADLVNANVHDNLAPFAGGGIYSLNALTVTNSFFARNAISTTDGGGIWALERTRIDGSSFYSNTAPSGYGGGLYNQGTLSVMDSSFNANLAFVGGGVSDFVGALDMMRVTLSGNSAHLGGGLDNHLGILTVTNSSLSGNLADGGGGLNMYFGTTNVVNSNFSGNSGPAGGGGMSNAGGTLTIRNSSLTGNLGGNGGGAIDNAYGTLTVANSTLAGNQAQNGGGIFNAGSAYLSNVTLLNSAGMTGTAHNLYIDGMGVVTLTNTIVSFNAPGGFNCFGANFGHLQSGGHNLASDVSCVLPIDELAPVDPMLAPLAYNGGPRTGVGGDPMLTLMPRHGSSAIDAIPNGTNSCGTTLITDQRGAPRPINGKCDIGAVEAGWVYPALWLSLIRH